MSNFSRRDRGIEKRCAPSHCVRPEPSNLELASAKHLDQKWLSPPAHRSFREPLQPCLLFGATDISLSANYAHGDTNDARQVAPMFGEEIQRPWRSISGVFNSIYSVRALESMSRWILARNSSTFCAPWSACLRLRTETLASCASRSPPTSM